MSFLYSTNSPEFLNYIAHTKTRNDILADPRLCVLLEDPYIKDNMELALLYKEAQYGTYEDKKTFVGFFLANGPELDTDTIMYFREKILHNPTYSDIYETQFSSIEIIDDLRINTYNKDTTDTNDLLNCLQNPCDYLGPFSASLGKLGDSNQYATFTNIMSTFWKKAYSEGGASEDNGFWKKAGAACVPVGKHLYGKLSPKLLKASSDIVNSMLAPWYDFGKKCKESDVPGIKTLFAGVGDYNAFDWAESISTSLKANTIRELGDCHRIWESMRRFRVYNPSENVKGPVDLHGQPKAADGTPAGEEPEITDESLSIDFEYVELGDDWLITDVERDLEKSEGGLSVGIKGRVAIHYWSFIEHDNSFNEKYPQFKQIGNWLALGLNNDEGVKIEDNKFLVPKYVKEFLEFIDKNK